MNKNIKKLLLKEKIRITPLLTKVIKLMEKGTTPISVDEFLLKIGNVNKTTIYRQMEKLKEIRIVQETLFADGVRRYCLSINGHHHHFHCSNCGKTENLPDDICKKIKNTFLKGYQVTSHVLEMEGICKECSLLPLAPSLKRRGNIQPSSTSLEKRGSLLPLAPSSERRGNIQSSSSSQEKKGNTQSSSTSQEEDGANPLPSTPSERGRRNNSFTSSPFKKSLKTLHKETSPLNSLIREERTNLPKRGKYLLVLLLLFSTFMFSACQEKEDINNINNNNKIHVITTIFPYTEFAKEIGKDKIEVNQILSAGMDAHSFEPSPKDVVSVHKSDLFIYTNEKMETWAHEIVKSSSLDESQVIEASQYVELIETHEHEHEENDEHEEEHLIGNLDPHIWLSFDNDQLIINEITKRLSSIDPENELFYKNNADEYRNKLIKLDEKHKIELKNCKHRTALSGGHNAFSYLTQKYNFEIISAYPGLSPDSQPTPKRMEHLIETAKERGIKYLLVESLLSPKMAEAIKDESGLEILIINPMANKNKNDTITFTEGMEDNLLKFKKALECNE